jgi:hypothetical protein
MDLSPPPFKFFFLSMGITKGHPPWFPPTT